MNTKKFEAITNMNPEDRYDYAIRHIAECEELWGASFDGSWILLTDNLGKKIFPLWPEEDFAKAWAKERGQAAPKMIHISTFIEKWIPGLKNDETSVAIFPVSNKSVKIISPDQFKNDLMEEIQQYE